MSQRTPAEVLTDLTAARAARTALMSGERVEDVWRDGRRMRLSTVSLKDLNEMIAQLENEYAEAVAVEAGSRKRSAIGIRF